MSFNVLRNLCGDSNKITLTSRVAKKFNRESLPFFFGKNPSKKNLSEGNPDIDKEAVRELGPGID